MLESQTMVGGVGVVVAAVVLVSGCRMGFDRLPGGGAGDDGGPQVDADPLAPDADPSLVDATPTDAAPDAAPAMVTETQAGVTKPEAATDLITIDPVLLSESFVNCSRRSGSSNPNLNLARCQLLDGSTLRIASSTADSSATTAWTVVQVPGAVVQRGTEAFGVNDLVRNVSISAVDRTAAFALVTTSSPMAGVDDDERTHVMVELTSDTNVRLSRGSTGAEATVDFQVIQMPATSVQSGVVTLGQGTSSTNTVLASAVDTGRTFLVHSTSIDADVDGEEAAYMVGSSLSNSSVDFSRQEPGEPVEVSWFAVELPLGSTVRTHEVQSTVPHDALEFEFTDAAYAAGMLSFSSVEIDCGTLRTSLNASSFSSEVRAGRVVLLREASDGNQIRLRTTVVDIDISGGGG